MSVDRRSFLKAAGLSSLAFVGGKAIAQDDGWLTHGGLKAKRWAMVVDLKKCREEHGCTKCADACHVVHNVPKHDNPKHEIKWIWKEQFHKVFANLDHEYMLEELSHLNVPVLCNHCDNPPCVGVCPTGATWKREDDGIVMMDWHRCIGCRYCMAACPYGSRSFNWDDPRNSIKNSRADFPTRTKGVVEKCTFCEERLARGLMPSCVEACDVKALVFGDLDDPNSEVRQLLKSNYSIRRKPTLGTQPEVYYIV